MDPGDAPGIRGTILAMTLQEIVSVRPDVMHGTPVFAGTRVPIQALLDYLEAGESLDEFLDDYPSVTREQAVQFIDLAGRQAVADAVARSA